MAENRPETDEWPKRDQVSDGAGPHATQDSPRDRAQDARRRTERPRSHDVDPDSADSQVDRDDTSGEP